MLLLDDDALFKRCHFLRDHGRSQTKHYFNTEVAYKYMPCNLLASLGYAQFQRVEELIQAKRHLLQRYRQAFADVPDVYLNPDPPGGRNGAWCTALIVGRSYGLDKGRVIQELARLGFEGRPFFYPLSSLPAYGGPSETMRARNPVAYDVSQRGICLPASFRTSDDQLLDYCNAVRSILGKGPLARFP
jgi:perosamine synthetase